MPIKQGLCMCLLILGVAACGEGQANHPNQASPAPAAARISVVSDPATIGAYTPPSVEVNVGDTVRWAFLDKNPHSATSDDAGKWDSKPMSDGKVFDHIFERRGTYRYHCSIHPEMHGTVVVR